MNILRVVCTGIFLLSGAIVCSPATAGVLDKKDVRAWWTFETKNGGKPIGETVSAGDLIDDSSPNRIALEVIAPQPMKTVSWEGGKALLFDGKTTWLKDRGVLKSKGDGVGYSKDPAGILDKTRDFSPYWAKNGRATHIVIMDWGWAWGYVGIPASVEQKNLLPVYRNGDLTQPGWNGREPVSPAPYEIRTTALQMRGPFTLSAWCRFPKPQDAINLISKNDWGGPGQRSFDFGVTKPQWVRLQLFGSGQAGERPKRDVEEETWVTVSGGNVPQDVWQFFTVTFDGGKIRFFCNGRQTAEKITPFSSMRDEPLPLTIGCNLCNGKPAVVFQGEIGEIVIVAEALTPAEILELYQSSRFSGKQTDQQKQLDALTEQLKKSSEKAP